MKIHHVGIVCKNIQKAVREYGKLFEIVEQSPIVYDELQKAELCLIKTNTGLDVEFISGEQVEGLLKQKISYYHLCYSVSDIEKEIIRFEENGALTISVPKPAVLFGGKRVAFLLTKNGLIEFVEE
jgi:methylmalonyl-CoA/ethylmalonyl-CoA epimerase